MKILQVLGFRKKKKDCLYRVGFVSKDERWMSVSCLATWPDETVLESCKKLIKWVNKLASFGLSHKFATTPFKIKVPVW